jgi:hypothetical protein
MASRSSASASAVVSDAAKLLVRPYPCRLSSPSVPGSSRATETGTPPRTSLPIDAITPVAAST